MFQRYLRAVITSQLVGKWGPVNTGRFFFLPNVPYVGALGVPMVPAWKEAMTVDCT